MNSNFLSKIFISIIFYIHSKTRAQELLETIQVPDWDMTRARNSINRNCRFDDNGVCTGVCSINLAPCKILYNFDTPVCGCQFCGFNNVTRQCNGQCPNTILQTCVSIKVNPKQSSDCICASCEATWETILTTQAYYYDQFIGDQLAFCEDGTCHGNTCTPFIASKANKHVNDTLYCACNNNFIGVTQLKF